MTIQFLTRMINPEVNTIVRTPLDIYSGKFFVEEENKAGVMATGKEEFYQSEITDFFFRKNELVITIH